MLATRGSAQTLSKLLDDGWQKAELKNIHYQIPEAACFNDKMLKNICMHCKWLNVTIKSKKGVYAPIHVYINYNVHRVKMLI
jgi:hypothetical protein